MAGGPGEEDEVRPGDGGGGVERLDDVGEAAIQPDGSLALDEI